jgi:hypothetical protein
MNKLFKLLSGIAVALTVFSAAAAGDKITYMFVGLPQGGPNLTITKAFGENLKTPNEFISLNSCQASLKQVEQDDNVVYVLVNLSVFTHQRMNEACVPKFGAKDIIAVANTGWHVCRKPGGADITSQRFKLGAISILPGNGMVADLNKQNNLNAVHVSFPTSIHLSQGLMNGDIDWGLVSPQIAEPLMQQNKIECPYTYMDSGTSMVSKDRYIGKHFKLKDGTPKSAYIIVAKTKSDAARKDIEQAVTSEGFKKWLATSIHTDVKVGTGKFTDQDLKNWQNEITILETLSQK